MIRARSARWVRREQRALSLHVGRKDQAFFRNGKFIGRTIGIRAAA